MKEVNLASAWGAKLCETFDFSQEDLIDDLIFNEVIWRSVRGPPVADAAAGKVGNRVPASAQGMRHGRRATKPTLQGAPRETRRATHFFRIHLILLHLGQSR